MEISVLGYMGVHTVNKSTHIHLFNKVFREEGCIDNEIYLICSCGETAKAEKVR